MENPQSLMHLQSSRGEGGGFQIKKPCCSPAAYRPLDILHLDQVAYHIRHSRWHIHSESCFQQVAVGNHQQKI